MASRRFQPVEMKTCELEIFYIPPDRVMGGEW